MAVDPGESATRESERGEGKKRDRIKRERGAEAAGEKKQRDETEGKVSSLSRARAREGTLFRDVISSSAVADGAAA